MKVENFMTLEISLISLGLLVGFSLGLIGSGGSILAIPLLIYGAKLPVHQATFVSLLIVGCISAIGAIKQFIIIIISIFIIVSKFLQNQVFSKI